MKRLAPITLAVTALAILIGCDVRHSSVSVADPIYVDATNSTTWTRIGYNTRVAVIEREGHKFVIVGGAYGLSICPIPND